MADWQIDQMVMPDDEYAGLRPGGDPLIRKSLENRRQPRCGHRWTSMDGESHRCRVKASHRSSHVCNCGASKKTKRC
jgi:hypothetical protein